MIRLDDPHLGSAGFSRADNLHSIAPGEADWDRLFALRNQTESVNAWVKWRLRGPRSRAPAVGVPRQQFALLGAAIYNNFQGASIHAARMSQKAA